MNTVSMLVFSYGARVVEIHDVEPELFEKFWLAFDTNDQTVSSGRISFDENISILLFKKTAEINEKVSYESFMKNA